MRPVNTIKDRQKPSEIQHRVTIKEFPQTAIVESNIKKQDTIRRVHRMTKSTDQRTSDDPASRIMMGMGNTVKDYGNILDGQYQDTSILNQSVGKIIEGDWQGAGKIIQENPYRFAGNLLVEAGAAIIPVGVILKAGKIGSIGGKILSRTKHTQSRKLGVPTKSELEAENKILKRVKDLDAKQRENIIKGQVYKDDALPGGFSRKKVYSAKELAEIFNPKKTNLYLERSAAEDVMLAVRQRRVAKSKVSFTIKRGKPSKKMSIRSSFERYQIKREDYSNAPLGALKEGRFRKFLRRGESESLDDHRFEQTFDRDMARKWRGLGLGLGGAGIIGAGGLSEADARMSKSSTDKKRKRSVSQQLRLNAKYRTNQYKRGSSSSLRSSYDLEESGKYGHL